MPLRYNVRYCVAGLRKTTNILSQNKQFPGAKNQSRTRIRGEIAVARQVLYVALHSFSATAIISDERKTQLPL